MRVVKFSQGGIVRRVAVIDDADEEVVLVTRFLSLNPWIERVVVRRGNGESAL